MFSSFQQTEYHIDKLFLENPRIELDNRELFLSYFANYKYAEEEDNWKGSIVIGFRTMLEDREDARVLYEIVISGQFSMQKDDQNKADSFVKRLKINGATTLIPIARAVLQTSGAAMGGHDTFKLPNINVFSLQWNETNNEEG